MNGNRKKEKILDEVREIMRLKHYSIHTKRSYCNWIKRFIFYHEMKERDELFVDSEGKIEQYLTHLATKERVAQSTQNQAMNALVFLYKQVLKCGLTEEINAVRAPKRVKDSRYIWLKNLWNLTLKQQARLSSLEKMNLKINRAYLLKERFRDFWSYKAKTWAQKHLKQWFWWASPIHNGTVEGLNNKAKVVSHKT